MPETGDNYGQQMWEAEEAQRRVVMDAERAFDWMRAADEAAREFAEQMEVDSETTVDADEARQLDVDGTELEDEEKIIENALGNGCYIDGSDVAAIHDKYEKKIREATQKAREEAKEKGEELDPAEAKAISDKLEEQRNKEVEELCRNAPKYGVRSTLALMAKQLRDNERGAAGRSVRIYRKDAKTGKLQVTTYGRNRVGAINRMVRQHEQRAASLKGQRANEQRRNLGHSTKEFLQGDAEHMFKGSVAMSLHVALLFFNKLAQAGNKSAQGILYLYAFNKLAMDDAEALQKAIDDTAKANVTREGDKAAEAGKAPGEKEVAGPPAVIAHGELIEGGWEADKIPMDFGSPDLPPFKDMERAYTDFADFDVLGVQMMFKDKDGNVQMGSVLLGTEQNIRRMYEDIGDFGPAEIDSLIAENAGKVEALGLKSLMVENVRDAYADFCEADVAQQDTSRDSGSNEAHCSRGQEKDARRPVGPVLEPGEEDVMDIIGDEGFREIKESQEGDANDVDAILDANREDASLGDDLPPADASTDSSLDLCDDLGEEFGEL